MSAEAESDYDGIASASAGNTGTSNSLRLAGSSDIEQKNIWIVTPRPAESPLRESFEKRFRQRAGALPTPAAAQAYDAVRILAAGLRRSGPNRARLRDALAELSPYAGASGIISFDHAGNDLSVVTLIRLP